LATKVAAITEEMIANAAKKVYVGASAGRSPSTTTFSSRSR
jgi:hypothetical protein